MAPSASPSLVQWQLPTLHTVLMALKKWLMYCLVGLMCCLLGQVKAQTISIGLGFTPVTCQGSLFNLSLPVTKTGTFVGGNAFRVELSQIAPTFSFSPPTLTSNNSNIVGSNGFANLVIPANTPAGQYKLRVVHVASSINSAVVDFTITPPYTVQLVNNTPLCATDTVRFGLNMGPAPYYTSLSLGNSTRRWKRNGAIILGQTSSTLVLLPNQYRAGDVISAEVRTISGCFGGPSAQFVVTRNDTLQGIRLDSLANRRVCPGEVITLNWANYKANVTNAYIVQLSDTLGRFMTPTATSLVTGLTSPFTIPLTIVQKASYRYSIRVIINTIAIPVFCDRSNTIPLLIGTANTTAAFTASTDSVCSGTSIVFTGNSQGFTNPQYTWSINGVSTGTNNPTLNIALPNNRDTVRLVVSGNTTCGSRTVAVPYRLLRVLTIPARPTLTDDSVCGQGAATLTALAPASGEIIRWFNNNNFMVATGNSYRTNTLTISTTYTAKTFNGICEGPTATVTALVTPIPRKPTITGFILPDTVVCAGGQITLQAANGASRYLWSTGATTASITVTQAGKYTLNVFDASCISPTSDTIRVIYRQPLATPIITQATPICGSGTTTLNITNPDNTLTYNWYDAGGTTIIHTGTTFNIGLLSQTVIYNVVGILGSCASTIAVVSAVVNPVLAKPILTTSVTQLCLNDNAVLTAQAGFVSYAWSNGATGPLISVNTAGKYTVVAFDGICFTPPSDTITILGSGLAPIALGPDRTLTIQDEGITLSPTPIGGTWQGQGVNSQGYFDPFNAGIGRHTLTYTITSGICTATASINIEVNEGTTTITNVFTPNDDNQNDTWEYSKLLYRYDDIKVSVLNRYGVSIFESVNAKTPWDGKVGGNKVTSGTYFYSILFKDGRQFRGALEIMY